MSDPNKKSWTFVPERSRVPPNRRATKRQTTVRAFTFVQDWDPRISPIPALNSSSSKQSSPRPRGQPGAASGSSQSSDGLRGESPIAQLVRSSPRPIIVARRSPASRISPFKTPYSISSPSSSQDSTRSRQKSTARRSHRKNQQQSVRKVSHSKNTASAEKTGADPAVLPSHSRSRHGSGSSTRSPVSGSELHSDSTSGEPGGKSARPGNESSITENGDISNISRVSPPLGEIPEEDNEAGDKDTMQSEQSVNDRVPAMDPSRTPSDSVDALEPQSNRSTSSESSVSGSRRKRRKRSNLLTFPKKSAKRGTIQTPAMNRSGSLGRDSSTIVDEDCPADRSVPRDSSRTEITESLSSSTTSQKRSRSTRRKRQSILTFKKKGYSPRSASKEVTSPRDVRGQSSSASDEEHSDSVSSSQQPTARRKVSEVSSQGPSSSAKGQTLRQRETKAGEDASRKGISRETQRTPRNKSMSLIAVTPRSGHVSRPQSRVNVERSEPGKKKEVGGARKRASESRSSGTDDEPAGRRAKVRLWTTGARPRLVGDTTDLDILLNTLEDTTLEFRQALDTSGHRRAVDRFLDEARKSLTSLISSQQEFKLQSLVLSRTNSAIRKYRQQLLNLQKNNTRLDAQIAVAKKKEAKSDDAESKTEEGFTSFLSDLQDLHVTYSSDYPKDINSVKSAPMLHPHNTRAAVAKLKSSLEAATTLKTLNDRLQGWLETH